LRKQRDGQDGPLIACEGPMVRAIELDKAREAGQNSGMSSPDELAVELTDDVRLIF